MHLKHIQTIMLKYISILSGLTVLLFISSCDKTNKEKVERSQKEILEQRRLDSLALKVGATPTMDCLPLFIAQEKGWYKNDGVDIRIKLRNSHLDLDTLLAGGYIEGSATERTRARHLIDKGMALDYIAETNLCWKLVTNKLNRIKQLSQLSDKMLAMTRLSATDSLADLVISKAKAKSDIYKIQINDVNIRLRMLLNNEMDAMFLPEPQATAARMNNHRPIADSLFAKTNVGVIAFRKEVLGDTLRRQQLKVFEKRYNEACDSINKYGLAGYADIISKYMGVDEKCIKSIPEQKYKHAKVGF